MRRHFEFQEGSSSKFWEIERNGTAVTTWWGRIGTGGQSKEKDFGTESKAQAEYDKLVEEKTGKGYVESGAAPAVAHANVQPQVKAAVAAAPAKSATATATAVKKAVRAPKSDDDEDFDEELAGSRRHFEFEEGNSSKFWDIQLDDASLTTWWGRLGTSGQSKTLDFDSEEEAIAQYKKLVAEKTKKGYEESEGEGAGDEDEDEEGED